MLFQMRMVRTLGLLAVIGAVGCGQAMPEPKWAAPVACVGTVTFNGKPLGGVQVRFIPDISTDGRGAAALTDQTGKFKLASLSPKGEPIDGRREVEPLGVRRRRPGQPAQPNLSYSDSAGSMTLPGFRFLPGRFRLPGHAAHHLPRAAGTAHAKPVVPGRRIPR